MIKALILHLLAMYFGYCFIVGGLMLTTIIYFVGQGPLRGAYQRDVHGELAGVVIATIGFMFLSWAIR